MVDAIDRGAPALLREELGDLLMQVVFLAELARGHGWFGPDDVIAGIADKLERRHPHVFGDAAPMSAEEVRGSWERIKAEEKKGRGALEGVPVAMPALQRATRIGEKACARRLRLAGRRRRAPQGRRGAGRARRRLPDPDAEARELGDVLFALASWARKRSIDPEAALRGTLDRFQARFGEVERRAASDGSCSRISTPPSWMRVGRRPSARSRAPERLGALRVLSGCSPGALRCSPSLWVPLRVLSGCSPGALRVLSGCSPGALRVLSGCSPGALRVLSGALRVLCGCLRVLSGCSLGALRVLSRCSLDAFERCRGWTPGGSRGLASSFAGTPPRAPRAKRLKRHIVRRAALDEAPRGVAGDPPRPASSGSWAVTGFVLVRVPAHAHTARVHHDCCRGPLLARCARGAVLPRVAARSACALRPRAACRSRGESEVPHAAAGSLCRDCIGLESRSGGCDDWNLGLLRISQSSLVAGSRRSCFVQYLVGNRLVRNLAGQVRLVIWFWV